MRVVFDLETRANLEAIALAPEPKAAGNLKDPEKIAADIAAKKADLIEKAALDPDYGAIRAIGYHIMQSPKLPVSPLVDQDAFIIHDIKEEREALRSFWKIMNECLGNCIGYNILSFDLPYLLRRSMALSLEVVFPPNLAKFRTEPITDLMGILYNWGPAKSLKDVCRLYEIPVPAEGVTGADVADMTDEEVGRYVRSDVYISTILFQRMNGVYFHIR